MGQQIYKKSKRCRRCKQNTAHTKIVTSTAHVGNLFLCVISCGLWLVVYGLVLCLAPFARFAAPWRCDVCGKKN